MIGRETKRKAELFVLHQHLVEPQHTVGLFETGIIGTHKWWGCLNVDSVQAKAPPKIVLPLAPLLCI